MSALLLAHLLTLALFMGLLLAAASGDVKKYRIPNAYSLALLALYPLFAFSAPHSVQPVWSLCVMAAVLAGGFAAFALGWIGGGDAKLLSAASLFAGPALIGEFLLVTALAGGFIAALMLLRPVRLSLAAALDHIGSRTLRDALLTEALPYGVAIAAGGFYLSLRLAAIASAAT
ncbi:MAG: prepilin peptidase [Alphaproteobacteria bacterium]|nr:prepilin peptidase [Alphaproteobacteria bacterium]